MKGRAVRPTLFLARDGDGYRVVLRVGRTRLYSETLFNRRGDALAGARRLARQSGAVVIDAVRARLSTGLVLSR